MRGSSNDKEHICLSKCLVQYNMDFYTEYEFRIYASGDADVWLDREAAISVDILRNSATPLLK